jgi:hypothetical protein
MSTPPYHEAVTCFVCYPKIGPGTARATGTSIVGRLEASIITDMLAVHLPVGVIKLMDGGTRGLIVPLQPSKKAHPYQLLTQGNY